MTVLCNQHLTLAKGLADHGILLFAASYADIFDKIGVICLKFFSGTGECQHHFLIFRHGTIKQGCQQVII